MGKQLLPLPLTYFSARRFSEKCEGLRDLTRMPANARGTPAVFGGGKSDPTI